MKKLLPIAIVLLFLICLTTITVLISQRSKTENAESYDGTVECDELDVASKIPGRVARVFAEEGQLVKKGDLLAVVETKEIDQKLLQAESAENAIGAQQEKALMGADIERQLLEDDLNGKQLKLKAAEEDYKMAMNATRPEQIKMAEADLKAKEAALRMAKEGPREETRRKAEIAYDVSSKAANTAKAAYDRIATLYEEGVVPKQKEEEVRLTYEKAQAQLLAAKEDLDMALRGARPEEIEQLTEAVNAARAQLELAKKGARDEQIQQAKLALEGARVAVKAAKEALRKADLTLKDAKAASYQKQAAKAGANQARIAKEDSRITAPIDGYISTVIPKEGELISAGYPLFTIISDSNYRVKVYIPETEAQKAEIGKQVNLLIPALGDKPVKGKITRVSAAADFATKVATNQQGSFDIRYIEITISLPDRDLRLKNGITARLLP